MHTSNVMSRSPSSPDTLVDDLSKFFWQRVTAQESIQYLLHIQGGWEGGGEGEWVPSNFFTAYAQEREQHLH